MATPIKRAESVDKQRCAAAVQRTEGTAQDLHGRALETVTCCIQVPVPDSLAVTLETLEPLARICVDRMLVHRERSSSAFYPELPCVIAKSLIAKYQRNKKCKVETNLVLPLCGDKGRQIKLDQAGIRIPALFQKNVLPVLVKKPGGVGPQCGVYPQRRSLVRLHLLPRCKRSALSADRNHRSGPQFCRSRSHLSRPAERQRVP
jgi:hypothetical protein